MGKTMTLRGTVGNVLFGDVPTEELILSYESPDRTKAWKVTGAFVWPKRNSMMEVADNREYLTNTGSYMAVLQTDAISRTSPDDFLSAAESRNIAWLNSTFSQVSNASAGYTVNMTAGAGFLATTEMLIDVDRLVTNQLYLSIVAWTGVADNTTPIDMEYMVVLEQVKVSNSQSLLQQLKGIGQSVN